MSATGTRADARSAGAGLFGINLFATGQIATDLPIAWAVLPARVAGVIGVTIPLVLMRRLHLRGRPSRSWSSSASARSSVRRRTPGAPADSTAIAAVIASQFAGDRRRSSRSSSGASGGADPGGRRRHDRDRRRPAGCVPGRLRPALGSQVGGWRAQRSIGVKPCSPRSCEISPEWNASWVNMRFSTDARVWTRRTPP